MIPSLRLLKEISANAQEALKNVTQARGYTKAEEETAKRKLRALGHKVPSSNPILKFFSRGFKKK